MKVHDLKARTIQGVIAEHVEPGSNVMTDEWVGYRGLTMQYNHHTVNHSAGKYVRHYFAHVNGLEGAWSQFKWQVYGIHHWISEKHTDQYLAEFTWRWNRRDQE